MATTFSSLLDWVSPVSASASSVRAVFSSAKLETSTGEVPSSAASAVAGNNPTTRHNDSRVAKILRFICCFPPYSYGLWNPLAGVPSGIALPLGGKVRSLLAWADEGGDKREAVKRRPLRRQFPPKGKPLAGRPLRFCCVAHSFRGCFAIPSFVPYSSKTVGASPHLHPKMTRGTDRPKTT